MATQTTHLAKTWLSRRIEQALRGEKVVIARAFDAYGVKRLW